MSPITPAMQDDQNTKPKVITVRYDLPEDAHKVIARKKRKLSIEKDRDVSMEEACIALLREIELAQS